MANKTIYLTPDGLTALETELDLLKTVRRKDVAEKIKVARSFGDLSENSEYDEAKNEQAMVEARIVEIEAMLKNVAIVDEDDISTDVVSLGAHVEIKNLKNDKTVKYKIVGSIESSPKKESISDESPVGKALIGRKVGDIVDVEVPAGSMQYEILDIYK